MDILIYNHDMRAKKFGIVNILQIHFCLVMSKVEAGVLTQVTEFAIEPRGTETASIQAVAASFIGAVTFPPTKPPKEALRTAC